MPNAHATLTGLFGDIADAIRAKTGESGALVADQFPAAIAGIPVGGGEGAGGQADMVKLCVAGMSTPLSIEKSASLGVASDYWHYFSPLKNNGQPVVLDTSQPFEIGMTFRIARNNNYEKYLWGAAEDVYGLPTLMMKNANFLCKYPTGSSSVNSDVNLLDTDVTMPLCSNIFAKVTWDGTDLTYFVDTGENQYTKTLTPEDPSYMHCTGVCFGTARAGNTGGINAVNTRFYMRRTYLKQNGVLIWGFDDPDWTAHAKLLDFDFTQSLTDSVQGFDLTTQNVTRDSEGLHLTATSSYAELRDKMFTIGMSYELDVGATNFSPSSWGQRLLSAGTYFGLMYNSDRKFELYAGDRVASQETDPHYLDNCTVRVYVDGAGRWHVYRNGVLWLESQEVTKFGEAYTNGNRYFALGSSDDSAPGAVITGLRVYEGNNGSV